MNYMLGQVYNNKNEVIHTYNISILFTTVMNK